MRFGDGLVRGSSTDVLGRGAATHAERRGEREQGEVVVVSAGGRAWTAVANTESGTSLCCTGGQRAALQSRRRSRDADDDPVHEATRVGVVHHERKFGRSV